MYIWSLISNYHILSFSSLLISFSIYIFTKSIDIIYLYFNVILRVYVYLPGGNIYISLRTSSNPSSQVELPQLREELRHRRMLRGGGAITRLRRHRERQRRAEVCGETKAWDLRRWWCLGWTLWKLTILPLGYVKIEIENCHRNNDGFHEQLWFYISMLNYQRV